MRILVVTVLLVFLGVAGIVVHREITKPERPGGSSGGSSRGATIVTISTGEVFEVASHVAAGRWTVFEFGADW